MRPILALPVLAFSLLAGALADAGAAQAPGSIIGPTHCATLAECLAEVRDPARRMLHVDNDMYVRMIEFGDEAVDALVPMLRDPSAETRRRAGFLLAQFDTIDPKHLDALVAAWRPGRRDENGWLPRAVAATRTDQALQLLWRDYLREPDFGRNSQIFLALAKMGDERIRPLMLDRFAQCGASEDGEDCEGLYAILQELDPRFPPWSLEALAGLASDARSDLVREQAEQQLVRMKHPAGRAPSQRRLAAFPLEAALGDDRWQALWLIRAVKTYGPASRGSAPDLERFLDKRLDADVRAEAALALGDVESPSSIPALIALEPEFRDDWVLAYNAAEGLGRLRASAARPLLERLARDYWHRGVRNNAARALNRLAGGEFARPGVAGDGAPYLGPTDETGQPYLYFGNLRWQGDDPSRLCLAAEPERRLGQSPAEDVPWPSRGAVTLRVAAVDAVLDADVRRRIPFDLVRGATTAVYPLSSGDLVALDGGEWGGGIFFLPENGPARPLTREPADAVWRMGGRVYVAAGLAHGVGDTGQIVVIDPAGPRIERTIRLPASARRLIALDGRTMVIATRAGDLAIREDGTLVDAALAATCHED